MKKYELLLILPGTMDDNEVAQHLEEVVDLVKVSGPTEVETDNLGKNRLAYPIKQIRYGYFYTIVFNAEPEQIKPLEEKLKLRADLLRAMITYFNTKVTAGSKIIYSTDSSGVTVMSEDSQRDKILAEAPSEAQKQVDLKDIDKKLDEILESDLSGV